MKLQIPALLFGCCLAVQAQAGATEVDWADLAPPVGNYENPFAALEADQLQRLARLLRLETMPAQSLDKESQEEASALRRDLTAEGLDVDWLFAERLRIMAVREKALTQPNPAILDQNIRLAGYILPLEMDEQRVVEFLLVPTVGACIHVPPPPANQIIHVTYSKGFEVTGLFEPAWIDGPIEATPSVKSVNFSDGQSDVSVSYTMQATNVEIYE